MKLLTVQTDTAYTQARGTWFCLHIGSVAVHFLWRPHGEGGYRLELFTPLHRFRWCSWRAVERRRRRKVAP